MLLYNLLSHPTFWRKENFWIISKYFLHRKQHYKSVNNKLPLIHEFGFRRLLLQFTHILTQNGGLKTLDAYTFCLFDLLFMCHWRQVNVIYIFLYFGLLKTITIYSWGKISLSGEKEMYRMRYWVIFLKGKLCIMIYEKAKYLKLKYLD